MKTTFQTDMTPVQLFRLLPNLHNCAPCEGTGMRTLCKERVPCLACGGTGKIEIASVLAGLTKGVNPAKIAA